jgi:hypothetical protein
VAKYWVAIVTWSDGADRSIEVVGIFGSYQGALEAVHAHLVFDAQVVMGDVEPGQRSGVVEDCNVTWHWLLAPVERIQA